jgi:hypothetical protein
MPSSISRIFVRCSGAQRLEDHDLIDAVHELRREFAARGVHGRAGDLLVERVVDLHRLSAQSPAWPSTKPFISEAPRLLVMMMMQLERSTRRLSPSVSVALSRMPSSNCQSESLAFSISSKSRIESFSFLGVELVERFLREQGVRLPVAKVSRRRTDQLGDFVRVLKFRAIDLDAPRAHRRRATRLSLPRRESFPSPSGLGTGGCPPGGLVRSCQPETSDRSRRPFRAPDPGRRFCGLSSFQIHTHHCCGEWDRARLQDSFSLIQALGSFREIASLSGKLLIFVTRDGNPCLPSSRCPMVQAIRQPPPVPYSHVSHRVRCVYFLCGCRRACHFPKRNTLQHPRYRTFHLVQSPCALVLIVGTI